MAAPYLKLYKMNSDYTADVSTELDITNLIAEGGLTIEHEDLDADKSGRNPETGMMERKRIAIKHTITVKLRRTYASDIDNIFRKIIPNPHPYNENPYFVAGFISPCANTAVTKIMYVSTINYGAQRYNRQEDKIFYDGVTFKMIER